MKRRLDRVLTIVVAAVFVVVGWSIASHTGWGAMRDFLAAGPGYTRWWEPLLDLTGAGGVAWCVSSLVSLAHRRLRPARAPRIRRETVAALRPGAAGR